MGFMGRVIATRRGAAPHCALWLLQLQLDDPFLISTLFQLLPQLRGSCFAGPGAVGSIRVMTEHPSQYLQRFERSHK